MRRWRCIGGAAKLPPRDERSSSWPSHSFYRDEVRSDLRHIPIAEHSWRGRGPNCSADLRPGRPRSRLVSRSPADSSCRWLHGRAHRRRCPRSPLPSHLVSWPSASSFCSPSRPTANTSGAFGPRHSPGPSDSSLEGPRGPSSPEKPVPQSSGLCGSEAGFSVCPHAEEPSPAGTRCGWCRGVHNGFRPVRVEDATDVLRSPCDYLAEVRAREAAVLPGAEA